MTRAAVVGGAGAVGNLLTWLMRSDGIAVTTIDLAESDEPDHVVGDITTPSDHVISVLQSSDMIVLALDERIALESLKHVHDANPRALIVETLSVKSRIAAAIEQHAPNQPAVGINPLFNPSLGLQGRKIAAVTYHNTDLVVEYLISLERHGATVLHQSADRHDRVTAATQALTHACVLGFGLTLDELDVTPEELLEFGPPPNQVLLALLARVANGDSHVYHDIQYANPYAQQARESLIRGLGVLEQRIAAGTTGFMGAQRLAEAPMDWLAEHYRTMCAEIFESFTGHGREVVSGY